MIFIAWFYMVLLTDAYLFDMTFNTLRDLHVLAPILCLNINDSQNSASYDYFCFNFVKMLDPIPVTTNNLKKKGNWFSFHLH